MSKFFETEIETPPVAVEKKKGNYEKGKSYISFSQYKQWSKCPASWKFDKIDKLGKFEGSVSTIFGTAIHEAVQDCLTILYRDGGPAADSFDYLAKFKEIFLKEFKKETDRGTVITLEDCKEHIEDGKELLNHVLSPKIRNKYFSNKEHELIGIEIELDEELSTNVKFKGFIDLVLKEKESGKIKIFDIKTSSNGWNKWQKTDLNNLDQVLLYKKFYSDRFKIPLRDIEVQFFILKRKLYEDMDFQQSLLQIVKPTSTKVDVEESYQRLNEFVKAAFDRNGNKNVSGEFPKDPGKNNKNCKYCPFATMLTVNGTVVCDKGKKPRKKKDTE